MIAGVILLAIATSIQAAPSPPPLAQDDIVVVGERLKRLRIVTKKDRRTGIVRCVFKRRSGDPALDSGVCAATLACVARIKAEAEIVLCLQPAMTALVPTIPWSATPATHDR